MLLERHGRGIHIVSAAGRLSLPRLM
jgi:hypothetical protein